MNWLWKVLIVLAVAMSVPAFILALKHTIAFSKVKTDAPYIPNPTPTTK